MFAAIVVFLLAVATRPRIVILLLRFAFFLLPIFVLIWLLRPKVPRGRQGRPSSSYAITGRRSDAFDRRSDTHLAPTATAESTPRSDNHAVRSPGKRPARCRRPRHPDKPRSIGCGQSDQERRADDQQGDWTRVTGTPHRLFKDDRGSEKDLCRPTNSQEGWGQFQQAGLDRHQRTRISENIKNSTPIPLMTTAAIPQHQLTACRARRTSPNPRYCPIKVAAAWASAQPGR